VLRDHPQLLFQQAANRPGNYTVASAAFARWKANLEHRPWVRWLNKPTFPDPCIATLIGHRAPVTACAYSPDGTRIISSSEDKTLRLWDSETGAVIATFEGHSDKVTHCAFAPDGMRVVSASQDQTLILWDIDSQRALARFEGHKGWVNACDFSSDGSRIVSASSDGTVRIWDTKGAFEIAVLTGHNKPVWACAYAPHGRHVVSGGSDDRLRIWDVERRLEIATLTGHSDRVEACSYSADGTRIVSASRDTTLMIWDAVSGDQTATLKGHSREVTGCKYSHDGKRIVSASWDGTIKVWFADFLFSGYPVDITTFPANYIGHAAFVNSCAYSPDRKRIVSGSFDSTLKIWDTDIPYDMTLVWQRSPNMIEQCAYSPDGRRLVSTTSDALTIWDTETGETLDTLQREKPRSYSSERGKACSYSPDGNQIACASETTIELWDVLNRSQFGALKGHRQWVRAVAYSPDGRRLVSGSSDRTLKLWDTATLTEIATLAGHSEEVIACAFSPDGRTVVSASQDQTVRVWDAETATETAVLSGHTYALKSCAYSDDGRRIASSTYDTCKIWDAGSWSELISLRANLGSTEVFDFVVDREHIFYASDENRAFQIFDAMSGLELACFHSSGWFSVVAFDKSLRRMAAGDLNGTVYVLERVSREPIRDEFFATITRLYCSDSQTWDSELTTRCERCRSLFVPQRSILELVREIESQTGVTSQAAAAALPESAWPRLISECPFCGVRLIFNPFIVDNRDRY